MTSPRTAPHVSLMADGSDDRASRFVERIEHYYNHVTGQQVPGMTWHAEVVLPGGRSIEPVAFGFDDPGFVLIEGRDAGGNAVRLMVADRTICLIFTQRGIRDGEKPEDPIRFDREGALGGAERSAGHRVGGFAG
jgi:hypothetical protein